MAVITGEHIMGFVWSHCTRGKEFVKLMLPIVCGRVRKDVSTCRCFLCTSKTFTWTDLPNG